jgi:hypothetical protein
MTRATSPSENESLSQGTLQLRGYVHEVALKADMVANALMCLMMRARYSMTLVPE